MRTIQVASGKMVTANEVVDEFVNLIEIRGKKVDHPAHGAKDTADAVAGSVTGAIELGFSRVTKDDIWTSKGGETFTDIVDREYLERAPDDYFTG